MGFDTCFIGRHMARALIVAACLLTPAAAASGLTIRFEAIDLADVTPGQDLWRYTYVVGDFDVEANVAFETLFAPHLYASLEDPPPPVNADWSLLTLQPDPLIADPGRYSALPLIDGASLADPFTVTFVWLGGPASRPGPQGFEINQFDPDGNFLMTLAIGSTISAVSAIPEPPAIPLLIVSLVGLARAARRAAGQTVAHRENNGGRR
jgi:hypothetical protein